MPLYLSAFGDFVFVAIVLSFVLSLVLAQRFRKQQTWTSLFRVCAAIIATGALFYFWLFWRHDYLLLGQDYSRAHYFTCNQSTRIHLERETHVVIGRYGESVSWIHCPEFRNLTFLVYDKSPASVGSVRHLPNLGYECSVYLHYIVEYYDRLPEVVVFVHADPFEHCPRFRQLLSVVQHQPFLMLSTQHRSYNSEGTPEHRRHWGFGRTFRRVWEVLNLPGPMPQNGTTYLNGQFAVARHVLRQHPRSFYQRALWLLTDGRDRDAYSWRGQGDGWLECAVLERLWPRLWTGSAEHGPYADPAWQC